MKLFRVQTQTLKRFHLFIFDKRVKKIKSGEMVFLTNIAGLCKKNKIRICDINKIPE